MDSVFVLTQNPPQSLSEKEMVLSPPTFLDEVKACARKKGSSATVGPNYLRSIAEEIGRRYDKFFNPYRNVVPHDFAGRICESDEDVAKTVHEMFQARYPAIYQRYYESILRSRPFTTKVIYFSGAADDAVVFQKLGIPQITAAEVSAHLGVDKKFEAKSTSVKVNKPESKLPVSIQELAKVEEQTKVEQLSKVEETVSHNSSALEQLASMSESVKADDHKSDLLNKPDAPKQLTKPVQVNKNINRPQQIKTIQPIKQP